MTSNRKIIILVEGASDAIILKAMLSRYDKVVESKVIVISYDIFADGEVTQQNIKTKILEKIKYYCSTYSLRIDEDIEKIIQITDSDGCFIPDDMIKYDSSAESFRYEEDGIYSKNPIFVKERNLRKRGNIARVYNCGNIKGIPFYLYYMSANLDHVLYNERNLHFSRKMKEAKTKAFEISRDHEKFERWLHSKPLSLGNDYKSSWEEIQKGSESLERHSNIAFLLDDLNALTES